MIPRTTIFVLLLLAGGSLSAADAPVHRDLVVGQGEQAVRIRVNLLIDGRTLAAVRDNVLTTILSQADANGDGMLSPTEWKSALSLLGGPSPRPQSDADSAMPIKAAAAKLAPRLGPPLEFVQQPKPLVDRLELFEALDNNNDRRITAAEFNQAPELMSWYDADGDGTLDMPELAPTEPLRPMPVPTASQLPPGRYPFSWEKSSAKDAATPDIVINIKLQSRAFGSPTAQARIVDSSSFDRQRLKITPGRKSVELTIDGLSFVFESEASLLSPIDVKRFFLIEMRRRDRDKNGYIDETEFRGLALPELSFATADVNGDEKLFPDELRSQLDGLILRETNRLRIDLSYEREPLFPRLDTDEDNRLSRRELLSAKTHALAEGKQSLSMTDFGGQYRLEFGVPSLLDEASPQMVAGAMAMAQARMQASGKGPAWFRASDRNRDGDLARREFLGTGIQFAKMDADNNGLISLEEINRTDES